MTALWVILPVRMVGCVRTTDEVFVTSEQYEVVVKLQEVGVL